MSFNALLGFSHFPSLTVRGEEVRNQILHRAHNVIAPSRTVTQHQTVRDSA